MASVRYVFRQSVPVEYGGSLIGQEDSGMIQHVFRCLFASPKPKRSFAFRRQFSTEPAKVYAHHPRFAPQMRNKYRTGDVVAQDSSYVGRTPRYAPQHSGCLT